MKNITLVLALSLLVSACASTKTKGCKIVQTGPSTFRCEPAAFTGQQRTEVDKISRDLASRGGARKRK